MNSVNEDTGVNKRTGIHSKVALDHVATNIPGSTVTITEPHISDDMAQIINFHLPVINSTNVHPREYRTRNFSEKKLAENNMLNSCYLFQKDCHLLLKNYGDINDQFQQFSQHFQ